MFTELTDSYKREPYFEIETVERVGDRETTTRITVEGLNAAQVREAITEALRAAQRLPPHEGE